MNIKTNVRYCMKKIVLGFASLISFVVSFGQGQTYVHGYYRSNGTYVEGHYRTLPNSTRNDNWSTVGNVNPYTGVEGTKPGGSNSTYRSYRNVNRSSSSSFDLESTPTYTDRPTISSANTSYYYSENCRCYITR